MDPANASVRVQFEHRHEIFPRCWVQHLKILIQEVFFISSNAQRLSWRGEPVDDNEYLADQQKFPSDGDDAYLFLTLNIERPETLDRFLFSLEKKLWKGARECCLEMLDALDAAPELVWKDQILSWRDTYGDTLLHCAVKKGYKDWCERLLVIVRHRVGHDLKKELLEAVNEDKETPLQLALSKKQFSMAQALDRITDGKSALCFAAQEGCRQGVEEFWGEATPREKKQAAKAACAKKHFLLGWCLVSSANAENPGLPPGIPLEEPVLHWILNNGTDAKDMDRLLGAIPENMLETCKVAFHKDEGSGSTALHVAAERGLPEDCEKILGFCAYNAQSRIDLLHEPDNRGRTPLHVAAEGGDLDELSEVCALLLHEAAREGNADQIPCVW